MAPPRTTVAMVLALAVLLPAALADQPRPDGACDCTAIPLGHDPVCARGITFINSCVAACQGMAPTTDGLCPTGRLPHHQFVGSAAATAASTQEGADRGGSAADASSGGDADTAATPATAGRAELERFASDGFVYTGRVAMATAPRPTSETVTAAAAERARAKAAVSAAANLPESARAMVLALKAKARAVAAAATENAGAEPGGRPAGTGSSGGGLLGSGSMRSSTVVYTARVTPAGDLYMRVSSGASLTASAPGNATAGQGSPGSDAASADASADAGASAGSDRTQPIIPEVGLPSSSGGDSPAQPEQRRRHRARAAARRMLDVAGKDERVEVDRADYPWSAVGYVASYCTGALVGKSTVLTAGHCVYDDEHGRFWSDLDFYTGRRGGRPGQAHAWTSLDTMYHSGTPAFCEQDERGCDPVENFVLDFALIHLEDEAGSKHGAFAVGYECAKQALQVVTAGYPADLDYSQEHMYADAGTLEAFTGCPSDPWGWDNAVVTSDIDTFGGQSGSPIWDDSSVIRAIHVGSIPWHRTISREVFNLLKPLIT